jgi:hypothetical protein
MKRIIALSMFVALAGPALAADPMEPVRDMMDVAAKLWSENPPEKLDYFDEAHLAKDYSKAFVAAYREAAKHPIYEEDSGPFGYDVITNGQDGCPLKEINVSLAGEKDGVSDVKATFKLWTCVDDGSVDKNQVSEDHFDVVIEDGRPVIADIHRMADGKPDSLMKEMQDIAKQAQ